MKVVYALAAFVSDESLENSRRCFERWRWPMEVELLTDAFDSNAATNDVQKDTRSFLTSKTSGVATIIMAVHRVSLRAPESSTSD